MFDKLNEDYINKIIRDKKKEKISKRMEVLSVVVLIITMPVVIICNIICGINMQLYTNLLLCIPFSISIIFGLLGCAFIYDIIDYHPKKKEKCGGSVKKSRRTINFK